ncbi:transmembrane protein 198 [Eurytemora carolleeae]|uniref:transmembrane protein 198 n=1 Tax=Eurytemora carolleeae TaxID=1294199 RepID=UPI000C788706|nr:transmembrane protein 198 [Eurytemora carolleeae]|eukprot:XP_023335637.1 transmembrane protein 198-like [Eurytemora affinis]
MMNMSENISDWIGRSGNESDWNGRSGNISDWDENGGNGDILNYEDEDLNLNFTQDYCQDHIKIIRKYDPYYGTVCALYFVFGIVCLFFGYRCFKAIMFFYGFIFGSIIVYLICAEEAVLPDYANAGIALSAGLLFGLITMLVQYVGLFMLGFHTGLLTGLIGLCCVELYYIPPTAWVTLGVLLGTGLLVALFNLYFQKSLTIFGSSLYGAVITMMSVDFFLQDSEILFWTWDRVKVDRLINKELNTIETLPKCWISWIVFFVLPVLLVLGLIVQCACTGKGRHHEESLPQVKYQKAEQSETKEERKQRKYRYLYQVRTCHGDVISQVNRPISGKYVQHLEDTSFR